MDQETIASICRGAIEVLRRDGWNRGALTWPEPRYSPTLKYGGPYGQQYQAGSHCIGGAVNLVAHNSHDWDETLMPLYKAIHKAIRTQYPEYETLPPPVMRTEFGIFVWLIATWNNLETTTQDDVIAILEKVAAA